MSQRFSENRWQPLTAFLLKILDNVSSSGSGTGIATSSHRGSSLKVANVSNLCEYFRYFCLTIPGVFVSTPVHCKAICTASGYNLPSHLKDGLVNTVEKKY
jgi:hypothetical protein